MGAKSKWIFPTLPLVCSPIVVIILYVVQGKEKPEMWVSWKKALPAAAFIVLNHYQLLSILREGNVAMPTRTRMIFDLYGYTTDLIEVFNPRCAGYSNFLQLTIIKSVSLFIVILVFLAVWAISHGAGKLTGRGNLAMELNRTANAFFTVVFVFFPGIVEMTLTLFKCSPNPNGLWSLVADRSIVCFSYESVDLVESVYFHSAFGSSDLERSLFLL